MAASKTIQRLPRAARAGIRLGLVALVTILAIEGLLQLSFPHLPANLIEHMPQFLDRSGFRTETDHGAREYPAGQVVDFEISRTSGDLYRLTCLSPDAAPPFDPYRVSYTRDSRGFRNVEPWPDPVDLVVIGDSFVAAESIVAPFWQGIADSSLVLGLPGSGALEQQRLFKALARPREPNTVVLGYFAGNDLSDNLEFAQMLAEGETLSAKAYAGKHPLDYSVLFNLLLRFRDAIRSGAAICHYPLSTVTNPPTPVAFYDEFLAVLAHTSESMRASEAFRLTGVSLAEMAAVQHARGGRFILMYIPQKAELYWHLLDDQSKATIISQLDPEHGVEDVIAIDSNVSAQRDVMAELAEALDIEFLDLSAPLTSAIDNGLQPYFFSDTHWNQVGHNTARIALLDQLNRSNLET